MEGPGPEVMSARSLAGDAVVNLEGESVGDIKDAPGFDKDHWPNMADLSWEATIHRHYGVFP